MRAPLALCAAAIFVGCGPSNVVSESSGDLSGPVVQHLVILLQENHTFDNYFGLYCSGTSALPTNCTGRACCQKAPQNVPGLDTTWGYSTTCHAYKANSYLDDGYNNSTSPDHDANGEYAEMHDTGAFKMDRYYCANVEYARFDPSAANYKWPAVPASDGSYPLRTYHALAMNGALADRYFQPIVGASTSNDMFLSRAAFVYQDNQRDLSFPGYDDLTIGDLLDAKSVSWSVYMGGLNAGCGWDQYYPYCVDPTDNPFAFSSRHRGDPAVLRDLSQFSDDLKDGALPAVSLLRALGTQSEHPEKTIGGGKITDGENGFIKPVLDAINTSQYANNTLVLITWDEGGGWYDHVAPPMALADGCALPTTPVWSKGDRPSGGGNCGLIDFSTLPGGGVVPATTADPEYFSNSDYMNGQEYYGTRLPLLALGPYARKAAGGAISHQILEHSSIVKFIEWNWLGHKTGQLGTRDGHVNNLGSMLDSRLQVPVGITD
jgi:phospholipase C